MLLSLGHEDVVKKWGRDFWSQFDSFLFFYGDDCLVDANTPILNKLAKNEFWGYFQNSLQVEKN